MRRLIVLAAVVAAATAGVARADVFAVVPDSDAARRSGRCRAAPPRRSACRAREVPNLEGTVTAVPFAGVAQQLEYPQLVGIWQRAGAAYGIPWQVLGAINKVESNFGRNMGPSSAGAVGWMQFMPSTWERWGVDANGDGVADPWNAEDAVFAAARYLAASGGRTDISARDLLVQPRAVVRRRGARARPHDGRPRRRRDVRARQARPCASPTRRSSVADGEPALLEAAAGRRGSSRSPSSGCSAAPTRRRCSPTSSRSRKLAVQAGVRHDDASGRHRPAAQASSTLRAHGARARTHRARGLGLRARRAGAHRRAGRAGQLRLPGRRRPVGRLGRAHAPRLPRGRHRRARGHARSTRSTNGAVLARVAPARRAVRDRLHDAGRGRPDLDVLPPLVPRARDRRGRAAHRRPAGRARRPHRPRDRAAPPPRAQAVDRRTRRTCRGSRASPAPRSAGRTRRRPTAAAGPLFAVVPTPADRRRHHVHLVVAVPKSALNFLARSAE